MTDSTVDSKVDSSIQQLNVTYHPEQDRLLLRVGLADGGELLLWLTRRVVKIWWLLLQQSSEVTAPKPPESVTDPMQREIMQDFAREAAVQKLEFSELYQEARENVLQHPLLIKELRMIEDDTAPAAFELTALGGQLVRINLNAELTLGLLQMLVLVSENTDWDLGLSNGASQMTGMASPVAVH